MPLRKRRLGESVAWVTDICTLPSCTQSSGTGASQSADHVQAESPAERSAPQPAETGSAGASFLKMMTGLEPPPATFLLLLTMRYSTSFPAGVRITVHTLFACEFLSIPLEALFVTIHTRSAGRKTPVSWHLLQNLFLRGPDAGRKSAQQLPLAPSSTRQQHSPPMGSPGKRSILRRFSVQVLGRSPTVGDRSETSAM